MIGILSKPMFSSAVHTYMGEDVVLAAAMRGEWRPFVSEVNERLATANFATTGTLELDDEIEAAADEFRHERDLLSSEEMDAWLDRWSLTADEWYACIERRVLAANAEGMDSGVLSEDADALEDLLAVELIVSGRLESWAKTLAGRVAVGESAIGEGEGVDVEVDFEMPGLQLIDRPSAALSVPRLAALEREFVRFRSEVTAEEAVEEYIGSSSLDFTSFSFTLLRCPTLAAAKEAVLCVRNDGMSFEQIAEAADLEIEEHELILLDIVERLRDVLLSAQAGDVLEVAGEDEVLIIGVRSRSGPSLENAEVREAAERKLLETAVATRVNEAIRWKS